jgi:hypothetical protein
MNSEVSHYDIVALRNANAALENQLRKISDELRESIYQQALRNITRSSEMEQSLMRWTVVIVLISMAFTLVITHEPRAEKDSSSVVTTDTE